MPAPKLDFNALPEVAWKWLMFTMEDVPGVTQDVVDSAMVMRGFHRVTPQILEVNGQVAGIMTEKQMFAELLYPVVVTDDFVLGRAMTSLVGCLGSTIDLGQYIEERFFVLKDDSSHPKTLQSALFDSGYVAVLDDCMEELFTSGEVGALVFHPERPYEMFRPIFTREKEHCATCQLLGVDCECNVENFVKKGLGPGDEWSLLKTKRFANFWNRYKTFHIAQSSNSITTTTIITDVDALRFTNKVLNITNRMRYCTYTSKTTVQRYFDEHLRQMSLKYFDRLRIKYPEPEDQTSSGDSKLGESSSYKSSEDMKIVKITSKMECHICGAKFSRKYEVRRHISMVHEAVKNHKCDICGRAFALKQHLNSHIDGVHRKRRDFFCETCGMAFATEAKVSRHYRCVHLRERQYQCTYCESSYFQHSDLVRHVKKKHADVTDAADTPLPTGFADLITS
mmetsp:Transcript_9/g.28  ORF Transcript_9/g.28 Transcript_9/m.28 type:complete len:452 (+) Transcript_9:42-1397(+)